MSFAGNAKSASNFVSESETARWRKNKKFETLRRGKKDDGILRYSHILPSLLVFFKFIVNL